MFGLVKFVFGSLLALALLVPVGIVLALIGTPILAVLALLAIPVMIVLAIIGLPLLLIAAVATMAAVAISLVLGLAVFTLKVAFFVVLPIALVVWLARRFAARRDADPAVYDWA